MRFVDNCRLPLSLRASGAIKPQELIDAETRYIKLAQQQIFIEEIRAIKADKSLHTGSKLLPLNPFSMIMELYVVMDGYNMRIVCHGNLATQLSCQGGTMLLL